MVLPLVESFIKKEQKKKETLPTRDGIKFLKIGNFVKVAEKWEKNRDSKQGQADAALYLQQARIKKPVLRMKRVRKLSEGAITEAVETLSKDLSLPLFKPEGLVHSEHQEPFEITEPKIKTTRLKTNYQEATKNKKTVVTGVDEADSLLNVELG